MKRNKQFIDKQAHFAIRKLSVGAASVLISTSVYLGMRSNDVLADTPVKNYEATKTTNNNDQARITSTKNIEVVSMSDLSKNKDTDSSLNQTPSLSNGKNKVSEAKTSSDTTEKTLNSAPVYTTQGQVPTLDIHSLFTPDQLEQDQIDTEDPSTSLTWEQKPDVSQIGNTSGIAKLSYPNYDTDPTTNDQGEDVYPLKDITVNIPVLVRKAEQEAGQDQVKNSLNIINTTDNSLVAHYEWIGAKAKNDDEEEPLLNSDSVSEEIMNILQKLGFETNDYSYFPSDIANFGTSNKEATIFVKPSSTEPVITEIPYFSDSEGIDNINETPDPTSYIGNLGTLPAGTKIEWNVAPKYDTQKDEDGNWVNEAPTNDPSIKVTLPGKDPIILDTSSYGTPLKEIATLPAYGEATLLLNSNNEVTVGDKVEVPTHYVTNLDPFIKKYLEDEGEEATPAAIQHFKDSFKWTVAPNTQQAGYTFGAFTYNDTTGNLILFKVNPIPLNNSKTITRTISFTGLPKNPDSVKQDVTYTQSGEQTYVDEPIAWKSDKNTWDEFVVPTVAGYTPDVTKIAPKDVNLNDSNAEVTVTYTANTHDQVINYVDKAGNKVGNGYTVTGKTGETIATNIEKNVPEGWVISGKYPTQVTFGTDDPAAINVPIEHGTKDVTDDPSQADKVNKTVTRTVNKEVAGKTSEVAKQSVTFHRTATEDLITKKVTYGDWNTDGAKFDAVAAPAEAGYTVSNPDAAPEVAVTGDSKDSTVTFNYDANSHSQVINYVDKAGKTIKTYDVTGKTGETGETNVKNNVPDGWTIAENQEFPVSVTFESDNPAPINVLVIKKETATGTPETVANNKVASVVIYQTEAGKVIKTDIKEQNPGEKVEFNVPEGYVPVDKLPEVTVNRDMSPIKVIVVKKETATGTPETVANNKVASVVIYQTEAGKVIKTDIKEQNPGEKVEFNVPEGYVSENKLPEVTVSRDMSPIKVIVVKKEAATDIPLVEDDPVKVIINYQDQNGKIVKTTDEDHKTGDRIKIDVPEGYVPTTTIPDVVATPATGVVTVPVTTKENGSKDSTPATSSHPTPIITNKPVANKVEKVVTPSKSSVKKVVSEHKDAVIEKTNSTKNTTNKVTPSLVNKKNIEARRVLPKTGSKSVLAEALLGLASLAGSATLGFIDKRKKN